MTLELRPYQRAVIDAIYNYFAVASGHPLIVIPTAGGKSLVMAAFIQEVLAQWPDERIVILTHVRELISQNFAELIRLWPEAPAGIYSAGLNRRDTQAQILFAGIQSVHRKAYAIQRADLALVDEAHLIPRSANTTYRRFLDDLGRINPQLKIIGLTATPYRLDSGMLHTGPDALFDDIAFEVSVRDLIDQGYLAPLISKQTATQLDVSGVGTRGGEFIAGQLEAAVDQGPITQAAIDEVVTYGQNRRSWLLFCAGVDHAGHVCEAVRARGVSCATIFGHTPKAERDSIIAGFKRGEVRALASMGVLTTGFNAPAVDLIAMLRPTKSTGLYVQMAGRGTRVAPGKESCLVLDFAGNVARHGPIDLVKPKDKTNGQAEGEAPTKVCPACQAINALAARVCADCGYVFPAPEVQLEATATTRPILSTGRPEWIDVGRVTYHRHESTTTAVSSDIASGCASSTAAMPAEGPRVVAPPDRRRARAGHRPRGARPNRQAEAAGPNRRASERPVHGGRPCEVRMTDSRGPCAVCRRSTRGFGWFDARFGISDPRRAASFRWFCSLVCQGICERRFGMLDPTRHERAAMDRAVEMAGEYVESLGRTDLMTWSAEEFATLIEVIVTAFTDRLRELGDDPGEVPYP